MTRIPNTDPDPMPQDWVLSSVVEPEPVEPKLFETRIPIHNPVFINKSSSSPHSPAGPGLAELHCWAGQQTELLLPADLRWYT